MQKATLPVLNADASLDEAAEYLRSSKAAALVVNIGDVHHLVTARTLVNGIVGGIDTLGNLPGVEPLPLLGSHELALAGVKEETAAAGFNPALAKLLDSRGGQLGLITVDPESVTVISASEQVYSRLVQPGVSVCFCKIDRILAPNRICPNNSAHAVTCVP
jgi:hypothetical protein